DRVDLAVAPRAPVGDVELAARVLAEGGDVVDRAAAARRERRRVVLHVATAHALEAADERGAEVRVEIAAAQVRHAAAPVDEPAGDGAAGGVRRLGPGAVVLRRAVAVV